MAASLSSKQRSDRYPKSPTTGMKIINVIPIARGIPADTLSYFSASDIAPGSIVSVPLRKRIVNAIAVSSEDAGEKKAELRASGFGLKKIGAVKSPGFLSAGFMAACAETADYFAGSAGAIIHAFTPSPVFEQPQKFKIPERGIAVTGLVHEKFALQAPDDERFAYYRSLIREEFARGRSVFFCLPTLEDIRSASETLMKGIEQYAYAFHGGLTKKQFADLWNRLADEPHPVFIVATASFLCLPRTDIGTIVVEKEGSRAYKSQSRPYPDARFFAESFAKHSGARIVFADILLRAETLWRHESVEIIESMPLKFRSVTTATQELVDMRKYKPDEEAKFRIISDELARMAIMNKENSERMFVYASRKGLAPSTVCADCGTVVTCRQCSAPIVLHKSSSKNIFICHHCGEKRSAEETCGKCGGWRLNMLGIGIERVEEELRKAAPGVEVIRFDKDSVTTRKQAVALMEKFYATPGAVLVGTEIALMYCADKFENAAIASIDSLFSLPEFRIRERVMHIILRIRSLVEKRFMIQTRNAEEKTLDYAIRGNIIDFYRAEIAERKQFQYPPFNTFIKVSLSGEKAAVKKRFAEIEPMFPEYEHVIFPAFIHTVKGRYTENMLIKIPAGDWPNAKLIAKLRSLPPHFAVKVDPESIL